MQKSAVDQEAWICQKKMELGLKIEEVKESSTEEQVA